MTESDYASVVRAACELSQAPLSDSEAGERGADEETRTAAREFLRAEFGYWKSADGEKAEPRSHDPYEGAAVA